MTIAPGKRRLLLALALAGSVVAAVLAPRDQDTAVVQAAPRAEQAGTAAAGGTAPATAGESGLRVLPLLPRHAPARPALFQVPPPPKPVVVTVAAPAQPVEPPLPPYHLVGRYTTADRQMVLLANGSDTEEVVAGDIVANGWRVDHISEDGVIFASPSGRQQLLPIENEQH